MKAEKLQKSSQTFPARPVAATKVAGNQGKDEKENVEVRAWKKTGMGSGTGTIITIVGIAASAVRARHAVPLRTTPRNDVLLIFQKSKYYLKTLTEWPQSAKKSSDIRIKFYK